ncbi:MAG: L-2-amino-thiazoline-4-carboxylic acid hydrolase [Candidatus Hodarchaeales archaeon]|jgi:hypothetical protein
MMKIESFSVCNPNARVEINLNNLLQQYFDRTDQIVKHLRELRPEITSKYLSALTGRLIEATKDFTIATSLFDLKAIVADLKDLKEHQDLQILILQFVAKQLDLSQELPPGQEKIEVMSLNRIKSLERLAYHRTKALTEVLGDEQGIPLWKEITERLIAADKIKYERNIREMMEQGKPLPTSDEIRKSSIKTWTKMGLADFTVASLDDDTTLYRFDRCLTHEALKDFEDPDIAYLCSCYIGDAEGFNFKSRHRHLRRTQTLHHGDFCDELYWDPLVCTNPDQPSLEFTRQLGRNTLSENSKEL